MTRLLHQGFRLEPPLIASLKRLAKRDGLTYTAFVREILRREVWLRHRPPERVAAVKEVGDHAEG